MFIAAGKLSKVEWGKPNLDVEVRVDSADEWVYVAHKDHFVKVWSGPACSECSVELLSVRRCQIHRNVVLVAVQCRLV
jgi:hypothetical protein